MPRCASTFRLCSSSESTPHAPSPPALLQNWSLWNNPAYTAPGEAGAITGITAACSGPGGGLLEMLPGTGPPVATLSAFTYTSVNGTNGTAINSLLGEPRGGLSPNTWDVACPPGQNVAGFDVNTESSAPGAAVVGLRFFCSDPVACSGQANGTGSGDNATAAFNVWTPWLGSQEFPRATYGLGCECDNIIQQFVVWNDPAYAAPGGEVGPLQGITTQCANIQNGSVSGFAVPVPGGWGQR